ncbi:MAG: anthranilate synthase component I family protein [Gemmataceae bacterium]
MAHDLPLIEELIPPPDPWETAKRLAGLPHLLFLDSADRAINPNEFNRYSYAAADPVRWISGRTDDPEPPRISELAEILTDHKLANVPGLPPFQGGIAGLFGYELGHLFEKLPRPKRRASTPDLAVGVYDWVISWDHPENRAWIVATGKGNDSAKRRMTQVRSWMETPPAPRSYGCLIGTVWLENQLQNTRVGSNFSRTDFCSAASRAIDYIREGDCFQVNAAQKLITARGPWPLPLYERLRIHCPSAFCAFFDAAAAPDVCCIVSSSPEEFLRVDAAGRVTTRPIKGTRPRFEDPLRDRASLAELLASEKDRAENVMIIDLLRNDLGKVCEYGSVKVKRVCEPASYRNVHHLVSEITGQLRKDKAALDLLCAAFPGGSVTGAPKVRAMQIIAELEPDARGAYCGCLGYLGFNGTMDTNILIRTMTVDNRFVTFPVGAGIVADSDPDAEYEETLAKAEGMLRALEARRG